MRTTNPTLNEKVFLNMAPASAQARGGVMTIGGAVNKTAILLALALLTAGWTWNVYMSSGNPAAATPYLLVGVIGGFIAAIATSFKPTWAPISAPIYALLEGLFLGGISAMFEMNYPGIALQAVGLTLGTLAALLVLYKFGIIRVTDTFRRAIFAATGGIALFYLASMVMGFFGAQMPLIWSNSIYGIGFSLFVVGIAAMNLVLDFDLIERGASQGAPKYMEWYGAFAMMVTLVWLYIEMLRLLSKIMNRR